MGKALNIELQEKLTRWINKEISTDELSGEYTFDEEINDYNGALLTYKGGIIKVESLNKDDIKITNYGYLFSKKSYWNEEKMELVEMNPAKVFSINNKHNSHLPEELRIEFLKDNLGHYGYLDSEANNIPNGYFQCWECGSIEPLSKRHSNGTCGC